MRFRWCAQIDLKLQVDKGLRSRRKPCSAGLRMALGCARGR